MLWARLLDEHGTNCPKHQHTQLGMSQKTLGIYDNLYKYYHLCHLE